MLLARAETGTLERERAMEVWVRASETESGEWWGCARRVAGDAWQHARRSIRVKSVGCRISCRAGRLEGFYGSCSVAKEHATNRVVINRSFSCALFSVTQCCHSSPLPERFIEGFKKRRTVNWNTWISCATWQTGVSSDKKTTGESASQFYMLSLKRITNFDMKYDIGWVFSRRIIKFSVHFTSRRSVVCAKSNARTFWSCSSREA